MLLLLSFADGICVHNFVFIFWISSFKPEFSFVSTVLSLCIICKCCVIFVIASKISCLYIQMFAEAIGKNCWSLRDGTWN